MKAKKIKKYSKFISAILSVVMVLSISAPAMAAVPDTNDTLKYDYVEELPDGGKIYTYIIDGIKNCFPVPPEGFNPLTASDETLATYGFPPRPTDKDEFKEWEKNMSAYKTTPIPEIEEGEVISAPFEPAEDSFFNSRSIAFTNKNSSNWSGYVAKGGTNAFAQVQGDFVQPTIASDCAKNTYQGTWIGLGGYNGSGKLVQTGTAMDTANGARHYYAWYEYISPSKTNPAIKLTSVTVRGGDRIHAYCSFQRSNNKFNAYIANNTNGTSQSILIDLPASQYYDGTTAEFINERPRLSNGTTSWLAPLTKSNNTPWSKCQVYKTTSTWTNLGSLSTDKLTMKNGSKTLAYPGALSGQTFTSYWSSSN